MSKLEDDVKEKVEMKRSKIGHLSSSVGITFLLLPFSILSSVGQSTSTIQNLLMTTLFLTSNHRLFSMAISALIAHTSLYGIVLVVPTILVIEHERSRDGKKYVPIDFSSRKFTGSVFVSISLFLTFLGSFTYVSSWLTNHSLDWINGTYIFQLSVIDLTPNIGVFWYFFTEMFDHFREFFLWTFQINAFLYIIPLAVTLRNNPHFIFFLQLVLLSILKPYPSVSDLAIYLPLLIQWSHLNACKF